MPVTVAKLPEYLRATTRLLADTDRRAIVDHLAAHPTAGDLIEGTGVCASCAGRATAGARVAVSG